jgi:hypothetical protein
MLAVQPIDHSESGSTSTRLTAFLLGGTDSRGLASCLYLTTESLAFSKTPFQARNSYQPLKRFSSRH